MEATTEVEPIDILLVEDNPGDVRLTHYGFQKSGIPFRFHTVDNGFDALAYVRRRGRFADAPRPHLVLLDLGLPKKDGHEVLASIKADPDVWDIPVVILTGSNDVRDIAKVHDHEASCYVTKPTDPDQFEVLARFLINLGPAKPVTVVD